MATRPSVKRDADGEMDIHGQTQEDVLSRRMMSKRVEQMAATDSLITTLATARAP